MSFKSLIQKIKYYYNHLCGLIVYYQDMTFYQKDAKRIFTVEILPENFKESFWPDSIAIGNVTHVTSTLIASDLVSVQPMNMPTGQLFYLDYKYSEPSNQKINQEKKYIIGIDPIDSNINIA